MSLIVPKVKKSKFNNIGVAEPKIGSQISEVTTIQGQCNKFVNELFRGFILIDLSMISWLVCIYF